MILDDQRDEVAERYRDCPAGLNLLQVSKAPVNDSEAYLLGNGMLWRGACSGAFEFRIERLAADMGECLRDIAQLFDLDGIEIAEEY